MTRELESIIRQAAEALIASGAKAVYLFGSAAREQEEHARDIDLAVSGLPPEKFYQGDGQGSLYPAATVRSC